MPRLSGWLERATCAGPWGILGMALWTVTGSASTTPGTFGPERKTVSTRWPSCAADGERMPTAPSRQSRSPTGCVSAHWACVGRIGPSPRRVSAFGRARSAMSSKVDVERAHGARHARRWRHTLLGRGAQPLRPGRVLTVGEVQAAHHGSGLPAAVERFLRVVERRGTGPRDAPPAAADADPRDPAPQEKESFSSCATSRETAR